MRNGFLTCVAGSALLLAAETAFGQAAPPPPPAPPPVTLWRFLGIPQGVNAVRDVTTNRSGYFPEKERKPPLLRIADPANLASDNPAIKKAAEIKAEEDLAKQKIKALKYLAEVGCGCYPGVDEALLAALDDCTEEVRYEAAKAIFNASGKKRNHAEKIEHIKVAGVHEVVHEAKVKAVKGLHGAIHALCGKKDPLKPSLKDKLHGHHGRDQNCATCGNGDSCCSEEVTKKLAEIVYERNEKGGYKEPSERVRGMAAEALRACCPNTAPAGYVPPIEEIPRGTPVGPERESVPAVPVEPDIREEVPEVPEARQPMHEAPLASGAPSAHGASAFMKVARPEQELFGVVESTSKTTRLSSPSIAPAAPFQSGGPDDSYAPELAEAPKKAVRAKISGHDESAGGVQVTFTNGTLPVGYRMKVYRQYLLTRKLVGEVEIAAVSGNNAIAKPVGQLDLAHLGRGDEAVFQPSKIEPEVAPRPETAMIAQAPTAPAAPQHRVAAINPFTRVSAQMDVVEAPVPAEATEQNIQSQSKLNEQVETAGPAVRRRPIKPIVEAVETDESGTVFIND